ncbi:hypothetical protein C8J57DRAFT_1575390 [Mycena rebaudengoi]|nr:hypothetical protein C8J57DRAFT_1575390 [Mycena rebaudengoi]
MAGGMQSDTCSYFFECAEVGEAPESAIFEIDDGGNGKSESILINITEFKFDTSASLEYPGIQDQTFWTQQENLGNIIRSRLGYLEYDKEEDDNHTPTPNQAKIDEMRAAPSSFNTFSDWLVGHLRTLNPQPLEASNGNPESGIIGLVGHPAKLLVPVLPLHATRDMGEFGVSTEWLAGNGTEGVDIRSFGRISS